MAEEAKKKANPENQECPSLPHSYIDTTICTEATLPRMDIREGARAKDGDPVSLSLCLMLGMVGSAPAPTELSSFFGHT